jgi:hypothetical protein
MTFFSSLKSAPGGTGVVFILILLLTAAFLLRFVIPALLLWLDLQRASRALDRLLPTMPDPEQIASRVMRSKSLSHAWQGYAETLHRQQDPADERIRATARAGHFFSTALLVEAPLRADFYRHLPGILTGMGIIGTFLGLIHGLADFEVNSDTEVVRLGLRNLIQGVGHAFQVSAAAISLAMLVTWLEKFLLSLCARHVIWLCEGLDSLFESGVEEEYLARLVTAGEQSAHQAADLKKTLLTQQETAEKTQTALVERMTEAIAQSLQAPLARMTEAVERMGLRQGAATAESLEPMLSTFIQKMESQWNQSGAGLEKLLAQSADAMRQAAAELSRAVEKIDRLGQGTVHRAAEGLASAGAEVGRAAADFTGAGDTLRVVSASLAEAANRAGDIMRDTAQNRDAISAMLAELRAITDGARREASLTQELVTRMESAATALGSAKMEAQAYLEGVNRVLAEAHASFADNVERTLREGNGQFHRELATAVDYLKGAIEDLGDTLESLSEKK